MTLLFKKKKEKQNKKNETKKFGKKNGKELNQPEKEATIPIENCGEIYFEFLEWRRSKISKLLLKFIYRAYWLANCPYCFEKDLFIKLFG